MSCEWGHDNCSNEGKKCRVCITESMYYKAPVVKNVVLFINSILLIRSFVNDYINFDVNKLAD